MSIGKRDFQKSLSRLQDLTKGTQLYHTPSDSNPGAYPGGTQEDLDEHGGDIHIDDNGTDYNGVRKSLANKVRKSLALTPAEVAIAEGKNPLPAIGAKISKGQKLTPAETWAVKGGYDAEKEEFMMEKGSAKPSAAGTPGEASDANSVPCTNAGEKMDESDVEGDTSKSFKSAVGTSLELQKGIEASPFLYELTKAIGEALSGSEARVVKSLTAAVETLVGRVATLEKSANARATEQVDFNKSLAEAVVGMGEILGGSSDAAANAANGPVGAPKSQLQKSASAGQPNQVNVLQKTYAGPGGLDMNLNKSQYIETMTDMVKGGKLSAIEVIKFESNGEILPSTQQKVAAYLNGKN